MIATVGSVLLALAFWLWLVPLAIFGVLTIIAAPFAAFDEWSGRRWQRRLAALEAADRARADAERAEFQARLEAEMSAKHAAYQTELAACREAYRAANAAGDPQRAIDVLLRWPIPPACATRGAHGPSGQ